MGIVYRAEDRVLGRGVAIKVLPLEGAAADPSVVARFEREARAAASLCHPNIVSVYDAGSDGAIHFIVMEHVQGMSLADLLSRHGRLEAGRAVALATQIASGLAAAHRAGIVHRDVKPANVMIDESQTVKLLDFGIARAGTSSTLTHAGSVLGSPLYIAPEVALGRAAEERSDVYSLGCVLYQMVTGQPPFSGELDAAVLHQHVNARPRPPRTLAAETPQALDDLIMQMLSKRAAERPPSALLTSALTQTLTGETPRRKPHSRERYAGANATAPLPVLGRTRPRRRARLGVAALIVAALTGTGFALAASSSRNARGSGQPAAGRTALHRSPKRDRQSWRLPAPAGAVRDAARLVAMATAALEATRTPAPTVAAPHRPAARPTPHHARTRPTHSHGNKQGKPLSSEPREPKAPSSEGQAESPSSAGRAEAVPVETAPAEAPPPPPSTSAAPAP
jgi:serine/threonine-protein kinase